MIAIKTLALSWVIAIPLSVFLSWVTGGYGHNDALNFVVSAVIGLAGYLICLWWFESREEKRRKQRLAARQAEYAQRIETIARRLP